MKTWPPPYICPFPQPNIPCYPCYPIPSYFFITQHPVKIFHNYKFITKRSLYSCVYVLPLSSLIYLWLTHDLKLFHTDVRHRWQLQNHSDDDPTDMHPHPQENFNEDRDLKKLPCCRKSIDCISMPYV
jgi:hypothetical protein